jgi:DNA phosphorothioation-associated putative methyltransferase
MTPFWSHSGGTETQHSPHRTFLEPFKRNRSSPNLIKLHRSSGKLSCLAYPDFDTDPHPVLARCLKLSLRTRQLECYDYAASPNPPILHRKETFLHPDHPLHAKFTRLTRQEEEHGLLDDPATIGRRARWESRLPQADLQLRGHWLVKRNAAIPGEEP